MKIRYWFYIAILFIAAIAYCIDDLNIAVPLTIGVLVLWGITELLSRLADRYV